MSNEERVDDAAQNVNSQNVNPQVLRVEDYSRGRPPSTRAAVAQSLTNNVQHPPSLSAHDHSASIAAGQARAREVAENLQTKFQASAQAQPNTVQQQQFASSFNNPPLPNVNTANMSTVPAQQYNTVPNAQQPQTQIGDLSQLINIGKITKEIVICLLYTSDAADE